MSGKFNYRKFKGWRGRMMGCKMKRTEMKGGVLRWQIIEIEDSEMSELEREEEDKIVGVRGPGGDGRGGESWSVR